MNKIPPVRIFVGSGEASILERKTLIHSLRKTCSRELDIYVFNGTHNAIEHGDRPPFLAPMSLEVKYRNVTEFSLYRFLIPEICQHQGRAIFLDSDILALGDIAELFDMDMQGAAIAAVPEYNAGSWAASVMLIDCDKFRIDLEECCREISAGLYTMPEFTRFAPQFLEHHPVKLTPLESKWNSFDHIDDETRLVHYTDLYRQPWKFAGHPFGEVWFEHFEEAQQTGAVQQRDIDLTIMRAYVRPDIQLGNNPQPPRKKRSLAKKASKTFKKLFGKAA